MKHTIKRLAESIIDLAGTIGTKAEGMTQSRLTETEFLRQVLELARLHGWRRAHFRPARTAKGYRTAVQGDGKGFPDLLLIRRRTGQKSSAC